MTRVLVVVGRPLSEIRESTATPYSRRTPRSSAAKVVGCAPVAIKHGYLGVAECGLLCRGHVVIIPFLMGSAAADHRHRARRIADQVDADRADQHAGEAAMPAVADDQQV